jgi:hypothetical protein
MCHVTNPPFQVDARGLSRDLVSLTIALLKLYEEPVTTEGLQIRYYYRAETSLFPCYSSDHVLEIGKAREIYKYCRKYSWMFETERKIRNRSN